MLVYSGLKKDFLKSVEEDSIAEEIEETIYNKMHKKTARNEFRSWENSLEYMYKVLNDDTIPENSGIAIEYNIPQTSKRVDFIISGYGEKKDPNVIIIELKQWDKVDTVNGQDALVETFTGGAVRKVVHPSYQAWSYAAMIYDYNQNVQEGNIILHPCAFMHNYRKSNPEKLEENQYKEYVEDAPIFGRGEVYKLREFIKKSVKTGDNKEVLYDIDNGRIRPSKSLQDTINSMLKGNQEFVMLDEQKVVYEEILRVAKQCMTDLKKRTVVVKGGPGTGKTVVAINLLAKLTNEGMFVQYTSKNSAPREVYSKKLTGFKKSSVSNMFKGSGSYVDVDENVIDVILCDEAHRLNEKSGLFHNKGENQIKEIINASLCSVFFIDESQRVTLSDIGSIGEIKKWADVEDSEILEMELLSQFRCNGSDGYLAWLDDVLEIRETANHDLKDIEYDIQIVDDPNEVREIILEKNLNSHNRARMVAGYCWEWLKDGKADTNVHDIKIGDFEMSWNLSDSQPFALSDTSVNEVGCIHTSQGLEFDYVGVIIGDDMRYENGHIVTDFTKRATTDQSLKGIKKLYNENPEKALSEADEIIKNTYRTLMTRGMKGCYVYCTDKNLAEYLRECLK
ncbi:DUF2075 domain-containing protein [Lachnospira multipara]|uniref:Schlafen group 3-like DNA/RNA helicase domain-containing protein n=1 Tax=Lachnospira multipara TaxID=28051 RepID=A0A1H5WE57_9FIRM|nr:DUF2075 domain-containing protein [Lachnospira multipara]SEF97658.1 hypothetical protein SAMN05216537_1157 [Lachnospira multipara]